MKTRTRFLTVAKRAGFRVERMGGNLTALAKDYPADHGCTITAYIQLAGGDYAPTRWADGACEMQWAGEAPTDAPLVYLHALLDECADAWQSHADSGMAMIERADTLAPSILEGAAAAQRRSEERAALAAATNALRVRS